MRLVVILILDVLLSYHYHKQKNVTVDKTKFFKFLRQYNKYNLFMTYELPTQSH